MNLNFDNPNCRSDDSTQAPSKTLDLATVLQGAPISALKFGEDIEKVLKAPHFEAIKFSNSSIRVDENEIIIETLQPKGSINLARYLRGFTNLSKRCGHWQ